MAISRSYQQVLNWLAICLVLQLLPVHVNAGGFNILTPGTIAMSAGKSSFAHNAVPDAIVETVPAISDVTGSLSYQWESSTTAVDGFTAIPGATGTGYSFTAPLQQTTYFRRLVTDASGLSGYTNIIKVQVVSVRWENHNYVKEHEVQVSGITTWQAVDLLPVGQQLESTTYADGIGR
jgi:hypothetical protein